MAKTIAIVVIVLIALLVTSVIVVVGIYLYSNVIPPGEIETYQERYTFYYTPNIPSEVEEIQIYSDISRVKIHYTDDENAPYANVVMDFKITAPEASDKSYTEWFKPIEWENSSMPITFRLETKSQLNWIFINMENSLTVTLRTDIVYNINAESTTGSMEVDILNGVIVESIDLSATTGSINFEATEVTFTKGLSLDVTTGDLTFEFTYCIMEGNIKGEVTTGQLTFKSYNMQYTKDSNIDLGATTGGITFDIEQDIELGADVTGSFITTTGGVDGDYIDTIPNVGARFSGAATTGIINYSGSGFSRSDDVFTSDDYPASFNYNIDLDTTTGSINVIASSS